MDTKTQEAIELSNAAARLLSQPDLPTSAMNLAEALTEKALALLDTSGSEYITKTEHESIRMVLEMLNVDEQTIMELGTSKVIRITITPKGRVTIKTDGILTVQ